MKHRPVATAPNRSTSTRITARDCWREAELAIVASIETHCSTVLHHAVSQIDTPDETI